jgi:hypothetical protein
MGFWFLTSLNVKGIGQLLNVFIWGSLSCLVVNIPLRKKRLETGFDERERKIYARASLWSHSLLMLFLACACIIPFYVVGGRNCIPAYSLPIILLSSIYIAQFTQSAVILIYCLLEEEK